MEKCCIMYSHIVFIQAIKLSQNKYIKKTIEKNDDGKKDNRKDWLGHTSLTILSGKKRTLTSEFFWSQKFYKPCELLSNFNCLIKPTFPTN